MGRSVLLSLWVVGLVVLPFFAPLRAMADIYRYVDEEGRVHFTNTPTEKQFSFYRSESGKNSAIADIIRRYASVFRLEEALVRAVIMAESGFDANAVSSKGAMGMMQLMAETAREMLVEDPYNPEQNIRGGTRYLRQMLDQFDGDLDLALAAYNAGPGTVRRHGGIPPYPETRTYIDRVKRFLEDYRQKDARL